ncbi:MAG TPA: helix-turn-helix domain-containing protein [Novosphingobium sp.]|nr:helix-turn-helix domain-containing protein [Novosphingobium sp.]
MRHAARREFAVRGVGAASIDRISETAGFSRGAFYSNYSGKHELLLELLEEHQTREIAAWQSLLDAEGSLHDILPILRDRFDAFARDEDGFLFNLELRAEAIRNPDFSSRYCELFANVCARTDALAAAFIARSATDRVSVDLLSLALRSFSLELAAEARLGLDCSGDSPGARLVAMIGEILGL